MNTDKRTDQELNRIIAEWMGWKPGHSIHWAPGMQRFYDWGWTPPKELVGTSVRYTPGKSSCVPPDYCKDLNAIHEAVQHLFKSKPGHFDGYWFCLLHEIVTGRDVIEQGWEITDSTSCSDTTEATARQRAEALVAVIQAS